MQKPLEEVEAEFKRNIVVPEKRPIRQFVFCPVGLPGTGKTTITKPIAEHFGLVRLSSDELRKLKKENGYPYEPLKPAMRRIFFEFFKEGHSIALDSDCGNPGVKDMLNQKNIGRDTPVFWIHIDTPKEFVFEKFRKHPPSWLSDNPEGMINNYLSQEKLRKEQNGHFDFIYTFDTSRSDIETQVKECIEIITKNLANT